MSFLMTRLALASAFVLLAATQPSTKGLEPLDPDKYPDEAPTAEGAGTKRGCLQAASFPERFAFVPAAYKHGGLTQSAQPTLWFHTPVDVIGAPVENKTIVLKIYRPSEADLPLFERVIVPLPTLQKGFVGVSLESVDVTLPADEMLFWEISIYCGGIADIEPSTESLTAIGWIQYIEPANAGIAATEEQSAVALSRDYIDQGLWYDAVDVLSGALLETPVSEEVNAAWRELLVDSGFGAIADETTVQPIELLAE